jgi:hypothetical protein
MQQAWRAFHGTPGSGHGVQIYTDVGELADSVAAYLAAGWQLDEPALLIATPEHLEVFHERLDTLGWNADHLTDEGLLVTADAEAVLASITVDGSPSPKLFEQVVGGLLDEIGGDGRHTRVFGEMVDLLAHRGRLEDAIALEELWTTAAERRNFSLLCGYCLDVFDRAAQTRTLPPVCSHHSHVLPAQKYARFARCVDRALDDVLGEREAGRIYMLLARQIQEERVPAAQLILMWVSANMPALAERILESARTQYAATV